MQKQTVKQLGKQMREKFSLRDDLPPPIRKALEKLSVAESRGDTPSAKSMCRH